ERSLAASRRRPVGRGPGGARAASRRGRGQRARDPRPVGHVARTRTVVHGVAVTSRAAALALLLSWPLQPLDDAARDWVQSLRRPALEVPMHVVSDRSRVLL